MALTIGGVKMGVWVRTGRTKTLLLSVRNVGFFRTRQLAVVDLICQWSKLARSQDRKSYFCACLVWGGAGEIALGEGSGILLGA